MIRCSNCGWNNNPAGSVKCEKCNASLKGSMEMNETTSNPVSDNMNLNKTVREIIGGDGSFSNSQETIIDSQNSVCPSCGYPLRAGVKECPQCGHSLGSKKATIPSKQKICSKCGKESPNEAAFCLSCGNPLSNEPSDSNKCPQCGQKNPKEAVFCAFCGAKMKSNDINKTILPSRMSRCSLTLLPEEGETIEPVKLNFSDAEVILNRENTDPQNKTITREEQAVLTYENKRWYIQNKSEMKSTLILAKEKTELQPGDIIMLGDRKFEFDY